MHACLRVCVCVRPTREPAAESKLHRGMKASGNFNIKREMSKNNSSSAAGRFLGFFEGGAVTQATQPTVTQTQTAPSVWRSVLTTTQITFRHLLTDVLKRNVDLTPAWLAGLSSVQQQFRVMQNQNWSSKWKSRGSGEQLCACAAKCQLVCCSRWARHHRPTVCLSVETLPKLLVLTEFVAAGICSASAGQSLVADERIWEATLSSQNEGKCLLGGKIKSSRVSTHWIKRWKIKNK